MTLAVFDIDNTIVDGQSQRLLVSYLFHCGLLSFSAYLGLLFWFLRYWLGFAHAPEDAFRKALSCFKGRSSKTMEPILEEFVRDIIAHRIYEAAIREIRWHQKNGNHVMLISNAVTPLVAIIARHFGIEYCRGTDIQVENGYYTGEVAGKALYGEEKKTALLNFLSAKNIADAEIWVYADHMSDLSLLRFARHPVVVNPGREMKKIAEKFHWRVMHFKSL